MDGPVCPGVWFVTRRGHVDGDCALAGTWGIAAVCTTRQPTTGSGSDSKSDCQGFDSPGWLMNWRQRVLVEQGGCPRCEAREQDALMARDIITHLIRLCADYERRLAPAMRYDDLGRVRPKAASQPRRLIPPNDGGCLMSQTVLARFYVAEIKSTAYGPAGGGSVVLQAVSRGAQNSQWSTATPAGRIEMTINNPAAMQVFRDALGRDVAITFEVGLSIPDPKDGHPFRTPVLPEGTSWPGVNQCADCGHTADKHEALPGLESNQG